MIHSCTSPERLLGWDVAQWVDPHLWVVGVWAENGEAKPPHFSTVRLRDNWCRVPCDEGPQQPQALQSSTMAQQMLVAGDTARDSSLVWSTPHWAQRGCGGHGAKQGSSGTAQGAKLSPVAEQGWWPLPQFPWARRQRTQRFLQHREPTDAVWGATNQS